MSATDAVSIPARLSFYRNSTVQTSKKHLLPMTKAREEIEYQIAPGHQLRGGVFWIELQRVLADTLGALDLEARLGGLLVVDE